MKDNVLLRTENMSRKYVISDRRETEIEVLKNRNLSLSWENPDPVRRHC